MPEVGLELHSNPRKHWTPPETCGIRPDPTPVRPSPRRKVWTLSTRLIASPRTLKHQPRSLPRERGSCLRYGRCTAYGSAPVLGCRRRQSPSTHSQMSRPTQQESPSWRYTSFSHLMNFSTEAHMTGPKSDGPSSRLRTIALHFVNSAVVHGYLRGGLQEPVSRWMEEARARSRWLRSRSPVRVARYTVLRGATSGVCNATMAPEARSCSAK